MATVCTHKIEVPLSADEIIEVHTAELPDADELLNLLPVTVDVKYWLKFAITYYKQERFLDFETILNSALHAPVGDKNSRQTVLSLLSFSSLRKLHQPKNNTKTQNSQENLCGFGIIAPQRLIADEENRKKLVDSAHVLLLEAEKVDQSSQALWIVRGLLFLERENFEQAEIQFQNVLSRCKDNLSALVGMAISFIRREEWKTALRFWQHALRAISLDPTNYPRSLHCNIRLAIGVCFGRLSMVREARTAFLRVLEINAFHSSALVLLASMCLNEMKRPSCPPSDRAPLLAAGCEYVQRAFDAMKAADTPNALVLARLADVLFLRRDYVRAFKAATQALQACPRDPVLLAEILYYHGRYYHHVDSDLEKAHSYYSRAYSSNPGLLLARYAQAQVAISRGEISTAIEYLDHVRAKFPLMPSDDFDTLRLLAFLHARMAENPIVVSAIIPTRDYQEARETSRQLYSRALELFKTLYKMRSPDLEECGDRNPDILLMYARLLETSPLCTSESKAFALRLYLQAREVLLRNANKNPVPPELQNNIGVLYHSTGDYERAKAQYHLAANEIKSLTDHSQFEKDCLEITVLYNIARVLEDTQLINEAERFHNAILVKLPSYFDSHMRLGIIAQSRGLLQEAATVFRRVIDRAPDNVDAHLLLGMLELTMQQTRAARKNFDKVLGLIDKFDLVSLLHLGNILLFNGPRELTAPAAVPGNKNQAGSSSSIQQQKKGEIHQHQTNQQSDYLAEAWKLFDKVLELDPRNPYAATGIAIALREKGSGWEDQSLRLFEQIRECDDSVPCFTVNYAHMLVEVGQYKRAIPLYEKALARFYSGVDADLLVAAARAQYLLGKQNKQADLLLASAKLLQRALLIAPRDLTLWFNLAIVLQDHTVVLSSERMDKLSVPQMRTAAVLADIAIRNMVWLAATPSEQYDNAIASQRAKYTRTIKEKLEKRIEELIATQRDRQKRLNDVIRLKKEAEEAEQSKADASAWAQKNAVEEDLRSWHCFHDRIETALRETRVRENERLRVVSENTATKNNQISTLPISQQQTDSSTEDSSRTVGGGGGDSQMKRISSSGKRKPLSKKVFSNSDAINTTTNDFGNNNNNNDQTKEDFASSSLFISSEEEEGDEDNYHNSADDDEEKVKNEVSTAVQLEKMIINSDSENHEKNKDKINDQNQMENRLSKKLKLNHINHQTIIKTKINGTSSDEDGLEKIVENPSRKRLRKKRNNPPKSSEFVTESSEEEEK